MDPELKLKHQLLTLEKIKINYESELKNAKHSSGFKLFGEPKKVKTARASVESVQKRIDQLTKKLKICQESINKKKNHLLAKLLNNQKIWQIT